MTTDKTSNKVVKISAYSTMAGAFLTLANESQAEACSIQLHGRRSRGSQ